jgi:hypothetical protein
MEDEDGNNLLRKIQWESNINLPYTKAVGVNKL